MAEQLHAITAVDQLMSTQPHLLISFCDLFCDMVNGNMTNCRINASTKLKDNT